MAHSLRLAPPRCKPVDIPDLCRACTGRHHGICGALRPEQLHTLSAASAKKIVSPGTRLIEAGRPSSTLANILFGVVKLTRTLPDGRQQIVGLQFAPDFVGRPFASDGTLDVEAVTDTVLCRFPRRTLETLLEASPELERRLYAQALAELDDARDLLVSLGRKTARERLASFLLLIARHTPVLEDRPAGERTFVLPLSRTEIADLIGLTLETVSRQMTAMRKAGIIEVTGRSVVVLDLPELEKAAGG